MGNAAKRLKKQEPKGRRSHENHSRFNQAWRSPLIREPDPDFPNISYIIGSYHLPCQCGAIIRVDDHEYAVCENCGMIFNDIAPPPKMYDRSERSFMKAAKA